MAKTVDARGLACPQPVLLAKKAIEENEEVKILVDNETAVENILRIAAKMNCKVQVSESQGNTREVMIKRSTETSVSVIAESEKACIADSVKNKRKVVIVLSDNCMGRGDDQLGDILIRSFLHTISEMSVKPAKIICYNAGVKLAAKGSSVIDDLRRLSEVGVEILVCGTCVKFYDIADQIGVGIISNMYDIADSLTNADHVLKP
ncbi:MAG: sulfurtransferase-like selenium metabolism protein YedF [Candidatus Riflebacteria bacterium]|nr:sulfurtransferase-like selenium metabolism protein YedF [Candidatus Riflebacteria bacterium]